MPLDWTPLAIPGQRAVGGETVLADSRIAERPWQGMAH
jgi:hypothetical protein